MSDELPIDIPATGPDEPLFDVVICNLNTGLVSSIAGYGVRKISFGHREGADQIVGQLDKTLNRHMAAEIVPTGTVEPGEEMPSTEKLMARRANVPPPIVRLTARDRLYQQRKADCLCVSCGSPNLVSEIRCAACLQKESEYYHRHARGTVG